MKKSFIIFLLFFGISVRSVESTTVKIYNIAEYNCDNGKLRTLRDGLFFIGDFLTVGVWYSKETFHKSLNKYQVDLVKDIPYSETSLNRILISREESDGMFNEYIMGVDCSNPVDILL